MLEVRDLEVVYPTARGPLRALAGVSLGLGAGETLGVVGESGCGKSTLGRAILGLAPIAGGQVLFEGSADLRALRRHAAMVFQDPGGR